MSIKFEKGLQDLLLEISPTREDRISYGQDAEEIRNYVMENMKRNDSTFKKLFGGLSLGGSCLDDLKIKKPDEFDQHMILRPSFSIKPKRDGARPGYIYLQTDETITSELFVVKRYVNRVKLQEWIRSILSQVIGNGIRVQLPKSGNKYFLEYPINGRGWAVAHNIIATNLQNKKKIISFDFVPVFEFKPDLWPMPTKLKVNDRCWFAVPQTKMPIDHRTFIVCAPHSEREIIKNKKNLKNSLRLMKALRDANDLDDLVSYMLKSVYLNEIREKPESFWEKSIGVILIHMLECLSEYLIRGKIPFVWETDQNHLARRPREQIAKYQKIVDYLLQQLKSFSESREVDKKALRKIFIK